MNLKQIVDVCKRAGTPQNMAKLACIMDTVKSLLDNTIIVFIEAKKRPKIAVCVLLCGIAAGYYIGKRVPQQVGCWWEASYNQKIDWDNFDFREISGKCVVKRGDRWLTIDKGVDAAGLDSEDLQ